MNKLGVTKSLHSTAHLKSPMLQKCYIIIIIIIIMNNFLASADGASVLMQQLLPPHLSTITYKERDLALSNWREGLPSDTPQPDMGISHVQKSWDQPRVQFQQEFLLSNCNDPQSRARLLAASIKESGAWLNAMPVSSLGLRLSNDELHIAVGLRLGAPLCQPHKCNFCSSEVDQLATHGLSCRHSQGRRPRHNAINDIILRSLVASNIPSRLEPSGLHRSDGKRPDGMSMVPWSQGKFLVWDATCTDTLCVSNLHRSISEPGNAAAHAEALKTSKYAQLGSSYQFIPIAVETLGPFGPQTQDFFRNLGQRLRAATGDHRSFEFLIQRISIAIQRGNALSVLGSLIPSWKPDEAHCFFEQ